MKSIPNEALELIKSKKNNVNGNGKFGKSCLSNFPKKYNANIKVQKNFSKNKRGS